MNWFKNDMEKKILALLALLLSFVVYLSTTAPTVPFWDCGEFIATSYTLGVPHPPGSPLFLLIGRIFSMLPTSSDIAFRVNLISPMVSALAVMFLFLIIVQLLQFSGKPVSKLQKFTVYGGAFIGAMTFAFTDSHWFNAVEAEVYAFSTFLTAIVVWLILVWEEKADQPGHERYLLIIAYLVGLAIGIHLLNLLAIFFIALIIYFKRKKISSIGWLILDLIIGVAIAGLLFLIFLQFKMPSIVQALLTLGIFTFIYYRLYRKSAKPRLREHAQNVLMAFTASAIFLVINVGVIKGLPIIADNLGLWAMILTIVIVFALTIWAIKQRHNLAALALMSLVLIIVGYSTYATIFIRSIQDPTIDENDPETTHQAVAYLEREQYGDRSFTDIFDRAKWKPEAAYKYHGAWDYFWNYQINQMYIRYFNWQFAGRDEANVDFFQFILPFPLILGIIGLYHHFNRDKHKALAVLALFLFTGLMIVLYLNQDDPQPRERDYSYVGSFFAFAIWIGIGATAVMDYVAKLKLKKAKLSQTLTFITGGLLLIALPVNVLIANYHEHDRSGNYVAWDYSYNILQSCDPNGIIFTNGDNDTFPLWYLQEVEHIRKDVKVVNLSLLNTPWYIKQLRNVEPKIDIGPLSDATIDNISLMPWQKRTVKISPPPDSFFTSPEHPELRKFGDNPKNLPPMEWEVEPTLTFGKQGFLRVQDIMVLQILEANRWKRPIYFATTVSPDNKLGMDNYMQMDGLGFRIYPQKVSRIDHEKLRYNLFNVFKYRNLNNPKVYYDDNVIRLIGNYRSAFLQLAIDDLYKDNRADMKAILDTMDTILPESVFPIGNDDIYLQIGLLRYEAGDRGAAGQPSDLEIRLEKLLSQPKVDYRSKLRYASVYVQQLKNYPRAIRILEELNIQKPNDPEIAGYLVKVYEESGNFDKAMSILDNWLALHPDDKSAIAMRDSYRNRMTPAQKALYDSLSQAVRK
jgi:hypothetical protein